MIVLNENKRLHKLMGLNPSGGIENIILRTIYLVTLSLFYSMVLAHLISHIRFDIYRVLCAIPTILGVTTVVANYTHLLTCRGRIYSLSDELQEIVNESEMPNLILYNSKTDLNSL